ncbi:calcium-binding protein [Brevundimonas sp.]|uniref:calcium-binding protein n=1 Tax=Brevundimonas sp. TaxID=1871086 RepID=UPI00121B98A5|nr:calcium-binding protein [Brevundimonas sp.]TAJ67462.1 MAG: calcium-binding protein [Brevundimonas sp.]
MPTITGAAASEILTGSAGDDVINDDAGGSDTLRGLGGNDVLHVGRNREAPVGLLRLEGGDGNDLLDYYVFNASQAILEGGAGDDVFRLWAVPGAVQISTGSGADIIDFGQLNPTWGGSLSVTDFTGGIGGDRIAWGDHPTWAFVFLTGWGGGNPFADGYLRLTQVGANAVLWMDLDGDGGSQAAFALVTFLNTQASALTAWNLGYDPAGAPVPGQTINGSAAGETLQGTNGGDVISGLDGDDLLFGGRGDDRLDGGAGNDILHGNLGTDVLDGGDGDDQLFDSGEDSPGASFGNDILNGGAGNDYISVSRWSGVADVLTLSGGGGQDELHVGGDGAFTSVLDGGMDADRFYLDGHIRARLTVTTGAGSDTIVMGMIVAETQAITVTDFTTGPVGDVLNWGSALDFYLTGWNGYNPFQLGFARLVQSGADVFLQLDRDGSASQHDWKTLFVFNQTTVAAFTSANLGFNPNVVPGQSFTGGDIDDVFNGTNGNDVMQGQGGNDTLKGGAGDDDLQGGFGRDILVGGEGDDRYNGGGGGEQAATYVGGVYTGGGDLADFRAATGGVTVDLSLPESPQNTGQGIDTFIGIEDVFGSQFDDVITGNRYSPGLLMGNDGNDTLAAGVYLVGGAGDDILIATFLCTMDGGSGQDTAVFDGPRSEFTITPGPDGSVLLTRYGSLTYTVRGVEFLRFTDGLHDINGVKAPNVINGTPNADVLVGSNDGDILNGGDSDDLMTGGLGDDAIDGGAGVDTAVFNGPSAAHAIITGGATTTVSGPEGTDTLTGVERLRFSDATLIVGAGGGQYFLGGPDPDTLTGTNFNDQIEGGAGHDRLSGGAGDDLITGGLGDDRIDGGSGHDVLTVSGAFSGYRLLMNGDDFILKGPDGGDSLTGVESIRFGDGRVLELNRMYGPDVDDGARVDGRIPEALLTGGGPAVERPQVLPGADDPATDPAKGGASDPQVLPGADDGDRWLWKDDDAPLVLPGVDVRVPAHAKDFGLPEVLPGPADHPLFRLGPNAPTIEFSGWRLMVDDQGLVEDFAVRGGRWGADDWAL